MKKTRWIALAAMMLLVAYFTGCNNSIESSNEASELGENPSKNEMAFVLQLPKATKARIAYYDQSDASSYKVQLLKSGTVLKNETGKPGDKIRLTVAEEGSYTIKVTAYKDTTEIAEGSATASISLADGDIKVTVKLVPKVKEVGIDVEIEWGSGTQNTDYKAGDLALEYITFDGKVFEKTGEVYATGKNGASITGADPSFVDPSADDSYKGVFRNGRNVTLSSFIMSKYEVTQELYTAVMAGKKVTVGGEEKTLASEPFYCTAANNDYKELLEGEKQNLRPAEGMTWYDAVYFCNALSEKIGLTKAYTITVTTVNSNGNITAANVEPVANANGYRLPTEAEWEFAARGGDSTKTAWNYLFSGAANADGTSYSDSENTGLDTVGWYRYNTGNGTTGNSTPSSGAAGYGSHEVGKKSANALGLYDMSGNVWEWCYDVYDTVGEGNVTNPSGPASGSSRVRRGGGWIYSASACSVANRGNDNPINRYNRLGFRVIRSAN